MTKTCRLRASLCDRSCPIACPLVMSNMYIVLSLRTFMVWPVIRAVFLQTRETGHCGRVEWTVGERDERHVARRSGWYFSRTWGYMFVKRRDATSRVPDAGARVSLSNEWDSEPPMDIQCPNANESAGQGPFRSGTFRGLTTQ